MRSPSSHTSPFTDFEGRVLVGQVFGATPGEIAADLNVPVTVVHHAAEQIAAKRKAVLERGQSIYGWFGYTTID